MALRLLPRSFGSSALRMPEPLVGEAHEQCCTQRMYMGWGCGPGGGWFPHVTNCDTAGCPIQLQSDTRCLEIASGPAG